MCSIIVHFTKANVMIRHKITVQIKIISAFPPTGYQKKGKSQ